MKRADDGKEDRVARFLADMRMFAEVARGFAVRLAELVTVSEELGDTGLARRVARQRDMAQQFATLLPHLRERVAREHVVSDAMLVVAVAYAQWYKEIGELLEGWQREVSGGAA